MNARLVALALLLVACAASPAVAAEFTVSDVATLKEKIVEANATAEEDTITLAAGTYTLTVPHETGGSTGLPKITAPLTIKGAGASVTIIERSSADSFRIFEHTQSLTLEDLTVQSGNSGSAQGGAILSAARLTISDCVFTGNTASGGGGAIQANANSTLTITGTAFTSNAASGSGGGGAIQANSTLTITATTFTSNTASGSGGGGGAIQANSTSTIAGTMFTSNTTTGIGGAIRANANSSLTIVGTTFTGNTASGGGAIRADGSLDVSDAAFEDNTSTNAGGAIHGTSHVTIARTRFTRNTVTGVDNGGAIHTGQNPQLSITDSIFSENSAGASGGAIFMYRGVITRSTFKDNRATRDGGAVNASGVTFGIPAPDVTVIDSYFARNHAGTGRTGGAIRASGGGLLTISGSTFEANEAHDSGGALFSQAPRNRVINSTFSANVSVEANGGAVFDGGTAAQWDLRNVTITLNRARHFGGGLFLGRGTFRIRNSILAGNKVGAVNTVGTLSNCEGFASSGARIFPTSDGHNLEDIDTCRFTATGDLRNTEPRLDSLTNNGGPTPTHALRAGSPAVDGGDPGGCTTWSSSAADASNVALQSDQRGGPRPDGAACDIGAYEALTTRSADVSVTKSAAPNPAVAESELTYTIVVTNGGPDTATGVRLVDPLPVDIGTVSIETTLGSCTADEKTNEVRDAETGEVVRVTVTTTIACNLGAMPAGTSATVAIVVVPTEPATLTNTASVIANEPDPDSTTSSNAATVPTTVDPVNNVPVAASQTLATSEDTPIRITLGGSDADGHALTFSTPTPLYGSLSPLGGSPPMFLYTPPQDFNGTDSFSFTVTDTRMATSAAATVTISVTPVNDAPVASAQSKTTEEDMPMTITLTGTDVDRDTLTVTIASLPAFGTLDPETVLPNVKYIPNPNANDTVNGGSDTFTFTVSDGVETSAAATVTISVTARNDAPVALDQSRRTDEDTPVDITLTGTDVDGDTLTFTIASLPTYGTLDPATALPNVRYIPNPNTNDPLNGRSDTFTFTVSDGTVTSAAATVTITVTPVNDAPVAVTDVYTVDEDSTLTVAAPGVLANDTDVDDTRLTVSAVAGPSNGALSLNADGSFTYTPTPDFNGLDTFAYRVSDSSGASSVGTVRITVRPVNDAPVASAQSVTTAEDVPVAITLAGTDVDGDFLAFTIGRQPAHGVLSGRPPNVTYTPNANANDSVNRGSDSFTFTVRDGTVTSAAAVVTITVNAVNDFPVAVRDAYTVDEDNTLRVAAPGVLGNDTDVDSAVLTVAPAGGPAHGTLRLNADGSFTYLPTPDFHGIDTFLYRVSDSLGASALALVHITVRPVNDPPVLAPIESKTVSEGTLLEFTVRATDVDGDSLTFATTLLPPGATFDPVTGTFRYTPAFDTVVTPSGGQRDFQVGFTVSDGNGGSAGQSVQITVVDVLGATAVGTNIVAKPVDTLTGTTPVTLTFSNVTSAGTTSLTTSDGFGVPPPPAGFSLGLGGIIYEITTTAVFSGPITVCISYAEATLSVPEIALRLYHVENGLWTDRTILPVDTVRNIICARVTSLSPFAVFEPDVPGRMHGDGHVTANGRRHHFEFEVEDRGNGEERGRFQYRMQVGRGIDRFVATALTSVNFSDDAAAAPGRQPEPAMDTVDFAGTGRWNGAPGYTFEARATDAGEPGRGRDTVTITIKDPGGAIVSTVTGALSGGNVQSLPLRPQGLNALRKRSDPAERRLDMQQLVFALQFRGTAAPGTEGTLHAKTTASSQRLVTTLGARRITATVEASDGEVAVFESEVRITGEGTFVESGTIRYGSAGSVTFTTVGQGVLGPSGIDGLQRGAVMWDVKGVDGMLAGASGLVTSNFSVGAAGEVIDNQFAQLFIR